MGGIHGLHGEALWSGLDVDVVDDVFDGVHNLLQHASAFEGGSEHFFEYYILQFGQVYWRDEK